MELLTAVVALYVIVDPLGNIPLFAALTAGLSEAQRSRVLLLSVLVASAVLVLFAVFGVEIFGYFGVELGDFMIASGLILISFSLHQLIRPYEQRPATDGLEVAVVPLAVPYLAGPASISYVLLMSKHMGVAPTLLAVAAVSLLTFATLRASGFIMRALGVLGIRVVEKIMLILSVAIGVSLVRRGLEAGWSLGASSRG
ncbi:MarC family protein [Pyrobaculum neutrophilum]|nr:MarC family protein [Pyrobaculum neutrophilum]